MTAPPTPLGSSSRPQADGRSGEIPLSSPAHCLGSQSLHPLIVLAGPTASGKSTLALHLAEHFSGEIVSCDSVAVYRHLDIGSAKPSPADRARIPHHGLDLYDPNQFCTAGDYARHARAALVDIRDRGHLPIVAGGTGLYLRALLEGLAPAPPRDEALRTRLRDRAGRSGPAALHRLHRLLTRLDPCAATAIHPNDTPKLIRSLEVRLAGRKPQTEQWATGRDPLHGFRVLALGLDPPRPALYARINRRAEAMFASGLLEESAEVIARFGPDCASLQSLGYVQAAAVLRQELALPEAIAAAQQGHRNYAKRQLTWFRKQLQTLPQPTETHWLSGFGNDPAVEVEATELARHWLQVP